MSNATEARDAALADVRDHAAKDFLWYAERALHSVCVNHDTFTAATVWAALRYAHPYLKAEEPRVMGAVMKRAIGKWCEPTDRTAPSDNRVSHNRRLTVWRSLVR